MRAQSCRFIVFWRFFKILSDALNVLEKSLKLTFRVEWNPSICGQTGYLWADKTVICATTLCVELIAKMVPLSCCTKSQYGYYIDTNKCQNWILGPPNKQTGTQDENEAVHYKVRVIMTIKQASHWHEFCSRCPPYGMPNSDILVARSLSKRQVNVVPSVTHKLRTGREMRDTQCHAACAINNFVVTSRDTLENCFWTFENFRHDIACTTSLHLTRIATHHHAHCHEFFPHWHAKLRVMA